MAEETELFVVVVNGEEQYSIWPSLMDVPSGWRRSGDADTRDNCLARIDREWTDLRPASLRREMRD